MLKMNRAGVWAIAGLLAVSAASASAGQRRDRDDRDRRERAEKRWGSADMPRAGVCLYENSNFRGQYFCVESDEDLAKMPRDMRDKISSMRILATSARWSSGTRSSGGRPGAFSPTSAICGGKGGELQG